MVEFDCIKLGMGCVYKIANTITPLLYIGATTSPTTRWACHKGDARSGSYKPLYAAMREYGIENFSFDIMEVCENTKIMFEREFEYIRQLNTHYPHGYNLRVKALSNEEAAIVKYNAFHLRMADYAKMFGLSVPSINAVRSKPPFNTYKHITRDHLPPEYR